MVGLARIRDGPWAVRWLVAVRAAVAAALAWQLCRSMWETPQPGPAVVAALLVVHPTVFRSCTAGLQYAAGCTLGALIALPAAVLVGPTWLSMTAVLLLSLLAAGHERLGAHGLHVPITAVFVLLLGPNHAGQILPHLLEIGVGIAVAVLFNALLPPPLRLRAAESALDRLRDDLAGVLDGMATAVREGRHPDDVLGAQWPARVADTTATARSALGQAHESLRWNVRARNRNAVWHLDRKVLESLERVAHDAEACVGALDALAAQRPAPGLGGGRPGRGSGRPGHTAGRTGRGGADGRVGPGVPGRLRPAADLPGAVRTRLPGRQPAPRAARDPPGVAGTGRAVRRPARQPGRPGGRVPPPDAARPGPARRGGRPPHGASHAQPYRPRHHRTRHHRQGRSPCASSRRAPLSALPGTRGTGSRPCCRARCSASPSCCSYWPP
ncbi:aromatic acid exporter family protein [Streptomyces sp. NPDC045369]|uniref:FUSC family protein n=1 Tax=Streptomyces sp. NPDC045369 TaxID=3155732 RepID=UPI0033EB8CB7